MKYFDKKDSETFIKERKQARKEYEKIKDKLPREYDLAYSKYGFHDYDILNIEIGVYGDGRRYIKLIIKGYGVDENVYCIKYEGVAKVKVEIKTDIIKQRLGEFRYDEMKQIKKNGIKYLKHDIQVATWEGMGRITILFNHIMFYKII